MASAFVPTARLNGWYEEWLDTMPLPVRHRMRPLFQYYEDTWLNGNFPRELWNMYQVPRRTNNNLEGWHKKFSNLVKDSVPHLDTFLDMMQQEEQSTATSVQQLRTGISITRRNHTYEEINARISNVTGTYNRAPHPPNNHAAEIEYVRAISYNLSQPKKLSL